MRAATALLLALCFALAWPACARADDGVGGGINPIGGNGGRDINLDIGLPGGGTVLILCPGWGMGANILGAGGGFCDFGFVPGGAHIHCEWGAFAPVAGGWQCWRVWQGQPDHPRLGDPDIIPDGSPPRADALWGPAPNDQLPPHPPEPPPVPGGPEAGETPGIGISGR